MPSVVVGISGGVDSSIAAYLLKEQGFQVEGVIFKQVNAENPDDDALCCSASAIEEARDVCFDLGIQLHIRDLRRLFQTKVINPTNAEMAVGNVPSPCTTCNGSVRSVELDRMRWLLDFDYFATGHYFKVKDGKVFRGSDLKKDQSYMVALVDRKYFGRWLTPLGDVVKTQVRRIADDLDLPTAHNPDSQDLCFRHLLPVFDRQLIYNGKIVGNKKCRTPSVGQKKGFDGLRVIQVNENEIHLVDEPVENTRAEIKEPNWLVDDIPDELEVQLNSHGRPIKGIVRDNQLEIAQPTVLAPGQVAAFYCGDQLLGGAVISRSHNKER